MKKLLLMTGWLALAACGGGGKSYSQHDVGVCPSTARCLLNPGGEYRVTLEGTVATNLQYECGQALYYVLGSARDGLPANQALCPAQAQSIAFFLGDRRYKGQSVTLGEAYLPQRLRSTEYRFTLADMVAAPRRISADDYRVRNRAALLMALDTNSTTARLELPDRANELISSNFDALVPERQFDYPDYAGFRAAWQPFLDAVAKGAAIAGFPDDPAAVIERLSQANQRTRAGGYVLETCQAGGAPCAKPEVFDGNQRALRLSALVLPEGQVLGLGQVRRGDPANGGSEDLVTWRGATRLDDGLAFHDAGSGNAVVEGLLNGANDTSASLSGRLLGHRALYINQRVDGGFVTDFELDLPASDASLAGTEVGRVQGQVLGAGSVGLSTRATATAPVVTTLDPVIANQGAGYYSVTLMRACTASESCADFIPNKELGDNGNYPICLGGEGETCAGGQPLRTNEAREQPRGDENGIETFIVRVAASGMVYTSASCADTQIPTGLISATRGNPLSLDVHLFLAPGVDDKAATPHFGTRLSGTLDLGNGSRPLYRTDRFNERLRGTWEDRYRPAQLRAGGEDDAQRLHAHERGAVEWLYLGTHCAS